LWKFVDGAKTAGELYGRALVVIAAEQHATWPGGFQRTRRWDSRWQRIITRRTRARDARPAFSG
jgi:hypothetical protein